MNNAIKNSYNNPIIAFRIILKSVFIQNSNVQKLKQNKIYCFFNIILFETHNTLEYFSLKTNFYLKKSSFDKISITFKSNQHLD